MGEAASLGDLLALGARSSKALRAWLDGRSPVLAERLSVEAALRGETIGQFLRIATADFLAEADEDSWASLVSALREADDPAAACVERVIAFRMRLERAP